MTETLYLQLYVCKSPSFLQDVRVVLGATHGFRVIFEWESLMGIKKRWLFRVVRALREVFSLIWNGLVRKYMVPQDTLVYGGGVILWFDAR